jgi:hypothetical protein
MSNIIEYFRHIWNGQIIKIVKIKIVCHVILPKILILLIQENKWDMYNATSKQTSSLVIN